MVLARLRERYPDRIPVIVDRPPGSRTAPPISKHKYLVPLDLTMDKFVHEVRQHIELDSQKSLFFFVEGTLVPNGETMSRIYQRWQASDGFLYVTYEVDNTFG